MDLGYDEARILIAPEDISLLFVRVRPLGIGRHRRRRQRARCRA